MGETIAEAGWRGQDECYRVLRAGWGCPGAPAGHGSMATRHARRADHCCRTGSAVRVVAHRLGVIVGEWVIQPGLDDLIANFRRCPGRPDAHALLP